MTLKTKTAIFILFFSFLGLAIPGNAQVNGYRLVCNGQSVTFSAVSGLDAPVQNTRYLKIPATGTQSLQTSGTKTLTLYNIRLSYASDIYRWFNSFSQGGTVQKKDVVVKLLDQNGVLTKAWKVRQAGPIKIDGTLMTADANDVTIETVVLTHEGIDPIP